MENLKSIRGIIWACVAIIIVELALLGFMLRPLNFISGASLAVVAVLCVYLVRIALMLARHIENNDQKNKR